MSIMRISGWLERWKWGRRARTDAWQRLVHDVSRKMGRGRAHSRASAGRYAVDVTDLVNFYKDHPDYRTSKKAKAKLFKPLPDPPWEDQEWLDREAAKMGSMGSVGLTGDEPQDWSIFDEEERRRSGWMGRVLLTLGSVGDNGGETDEK